MMRNWTVTEYETGYTLLETLQLRIPAAPQGFLRKVCTKGRVTSNGRALTATDTLCREMSLELRCSARLDELINESRLPPEALLFEDRQTMVIFKPAEMATHLGKGHDDNLQARVEGFLKLRREPFRTAPAHRLDLGTSGPVLFGKGQQAIRQLGQQFMDRTVGKHYLALVSGQPDDQGRLTTPVKAHGKYKESQTSYRCLGRSGQTALLDLDLQTGRLHQVRRQLAEAGWPILGDDRYGSKAPGPGRLFLHCHLLTFRSLVDQQPRRISCALPQRLRDYLEQSGLNPDHS